MYTTADVWDQKCLEHEMDRFGYDQTRGTVIGDHGIVGRLYYEGRAQGHTLYGDYEPDLVDQATRYMAKLKADYPGTYPEDDAWRLHIPQGSNPSSP